VERITSKRRDSACEAVVVHCSDHRFQQGFRELIALELGLVSYSLLAIPGGPHFGSMGQLQPKFSGAAIRNLRFLLKLSSVPRIILLAHDDCLFFKSQLQFFFSEPDFNQKQITSLRRAGSVLAERFSRARIELFLVKADAAGSLSLERVR
jgi:hypothetical protein